MKVTKVLQERRNKMNWSGLFGLLERMSDERLVLKKVYREEVD